MMFDALYQFPTYFRSLQETVGSRTDLRPRVHVELAKMLTGQGYLARQELVPSRALFVTQVCDSLAVIDRPVSTPDERRTALLFAASPSEAMEWAEEYEGEPAERIATLERSGDLLPLNEGPNQQPGLPRQYRGVLNASILRRLDVPEATIEAVLESPFPGDAASLGLPQVILDRVNTRFLSELTTTRRHLPSPGAGTLLPIRVTLETLVAQLRLPLAHYLLQLTPEQHKIATRPVRQGPELIRGAAGTGKTLVGLVRMRHLVDQMDLFANRPLLFTCYNRVLASVAQSLLPSILGPKRNHSLVKVQTIFSLLMEWKRKLDPAWNFNPDEIGLRQVLSEVRHGSDIGELPSWTDGELLEEFTEIIYARSIRRFEDYLAADRRSRGRNRELSPDQRAAVWQLYSAFRRVTWRSGLTPWAQVAARLDGILQATPPAEPAYAGVIIDEVQDFTPSMVRVLKQLQAGREDRFLLLGDPTQTVTQAGFHWSDLPLTIRPRNITTMKRSFRCSYAIISAAKPLAEEQTDVIGGEVLVPDVMRDDRPKVEVWLCASAAVELKAVADRIESLVNQGMPPSNIAVLTDAKSFMSRLTHHLTTRHIRTQFSNSSQGKAGIDVMDPSVKLMGSKAAKGLEFQVVFLPGITESYFPTVPGKGVDLTQKRRALYVTMTRAGYSLVLSSCTPGESGLLSQLDPQHLTVRRWTESH